jgi:hypothetical protein
MAVCPVCERLVSISPGEWKTQAVTVRGEFVTFTIPAQRWWRIAFHDQDGDGQLCPGSRRQI